MLLLYLMMMMMYLIDPMDVVCYCSVGYRSSLVAEKLQDYVKKSKGTGTKTPVSLRYQGLGPPVSLRYQGQISVRKLGITSINCLVFFSDAASTNVSVYNLEGSLFKWANENRHMINSQGETTKFAHPYNTVFGKLLNSELRKS